MDPELMTGVLSKKQKGFGFVECENMEEDIFVPAVLMNGAMDGDTVEVELTPSASGGPSTRGAVRRILTRKITEVAGLFRAYRKGSEVIPEGGAFQEPVRIRRKQDGGAQDGDYVVAEITRYPDRTRPAEGRITEILAPSGMPGGDILAIARNYGLKDRFPGKADAEAKALNATGIMDQELCGRRDLRQQRIFTIDGPDARDFDDAVSLTMLDSGNYSLGIHIADVSHYVKEGGPMDREALSRGTSTYFPDKVFPMLPTALSNGICSLQPGADRLTLSLDIELDPEGNVVDHEICESVIRSCARLVYDDVSDLLEQMSGSPAQGELPDRETCREILSADPAASLAGDPREIAADLVRMESLAQILRGRREARGSIDFDLDEAFIRLDAQGRPEEIGVSDRRTANRLIEDFMILANETIAEHYCWLEAPFIYRVHESPEHSRIMALREFLRNFGIPLRGDPGNMHPAALRNVLEQIRGTAHENVVSTIVLRSMQKACYRSSCDGHFGLAAPYYCHFTSPIRRYPDLFIHRVIKASLRASGGRDSDAEDLAAVYQRYGETAAGAAKTSSVAERRSVSAEREVEKLKKAQYMEEHIGEEFIGVISGIVPFGLYVQLENTIEGLVHVSELFDDHYEADRNRYALVGVRSKKRYQLGDRMVVIAESVDVHAREIRFLPA